MRCIGKLMVVLLCGGMATAAVCAEQPPGAPRGYEPKKADLGRALFNDPSLSNPPGQSCATCHLPDRAFAENLPVSVGRNGKQGARNAPTLLYTQFAPALFYEDWRETWVGGQFWDGRADTLQEQALGPLLNPHEMNNTPGTLAHSLRNLSYKSLFIDIFGKEVFTNDDRLITAAAEALQAFQMTDAFAPFSSKFDYAQQGLLELTEQEKFGREVFGTKGMCQDCHSGEINNRSVFTQFVYHNIWVPDNPELKDAHFQPDPGLGGNEKLNADERKRATGRFRTPTVRNVALTAPYMHNGVFKTLRDVMDYYNNMDDRKRWGPIPYPDNVSRLLNTQLELTEEEIEAVIVFLHTLTDGYPLPTSTPPAQPPLTAPQTQGSN